MATQTIPPPGTVPIMPDEIPSYLQAQPAPLPAPVQAPDFYRNLADELNDPVLMQISNQVLTWYQDDESAREQWLRGWKDSAEYLGLTYDKTRSEPWEGASGVYDTALLEANMRFVSEMSTSVFSSSGPCKADCYGQLTDEKQQAALRVADHMNWTLLKAMEDFRAETEQLNWGVGFQGIGFKKVIKNPVTRDPQSNYVRANMLFVPIGYSTLTKSPRIIEYMPMTMAEIQRGKATGFYRQNFMSMAVRRKYDLVEQADQRDSGLRPSLGQDEDVELLEAHVELEIDPENPYAEIPYPLPYVVTIDKNSSSVASIRRNWIEGDGEYKRRQTYVEYSFMPTDKFGVYAIGLAQILANLARASTGLIRGMLDAATLNNMRGGLRSQDVRTKNDDLSITPGEWKVVECSPEDLQNGMWSPEYKPPDTVLFQMLGELDMRSRRLAGNADLNISEMSGQTPVGTVLAIIERGIKVFTSIQSRYASSFDQELQLIRDINYDELKSRSGDLISLKNRQFTITAEDYELAMVASTIDPDSGTISQRILQGQSAVQLMQAVPGPFDEKASCRNVLLSMGVKDVDSWIPQDPIVPRLDPVSENARIIVGQPVQAFKDQDHLAHLTTHQSVLQNPQLQQEMQNDPQAQTKLAAATAHVSEHLAFMQRLEIEKILGFALPDQMSPEEENYLAPLIASAAQQAAANPPQPITPPQQQNQPVDPIAQQAQVQNQLKQAELQGKQQIETAKLAQKAAQDQKRNQLEEQRISTSNAIAEQNLQLRGANKAKGPIMPGQVQ
ncbi:MAG: hypothetical protein WAN65_13395 [Candidatus Sulfotelmatobacter sp.]